VFSDEDAFPTPKRFSNSPDRAASGHEIFFPVRVDPRANLDPELALDHFDAADLLGPLDDAFSGIPPHQMKFFLSWMAPSIFMSLISGMRSHTG
jgi:hypothetical protein